MGSSARGRFGLVLLVIAAAAAVPRLVLGASQFIEYDGYWHVFIAQQDNWNNFWADIHANAHPPLFFLLLKAILHFGRSLLIYRSISIASGVATVALVGWLARKVTRADTFGALTALAYGLALPAIIVSCEVRSYMLSEFFVLLSFWGLLDVVGSEESGGNRKARFVFAAGAILACLSHYYAFFYSGAGMLLFFWRFGWKWVRGEVVNWKAALGAEVATTLPVAATILIQYKTHAGNLAEIQNHLLPYYFNPHGRETIGAFLLRNWTNFLNLFSPFPISSAAVAFAVLLLGLIGFLLTADLFNRWKDAARRQASATVLMTGIMLAAIVLAAVAGKYPFGGDLRQQYLLFPFLLLCVAIFAERLAGPLARLMPGYLAVSAGVLATVAIIWISTVRYQQYPKVQTNVLADSNATFNRLESKPVAVYVDQFNLITFFIYHHDWKWKFVKVEPPIPGIDVYRLTRGSDQMLLFRDKIDWNVDLDEAAVYKMLAECLQKEKIADVTVFDVRQVPPKAPLADIGSAQRELVALAAASHLCVEKMKVMPNEWYATFQESNCAAQRVLRIERAPGEVSRDVPAQAYPVQAGGIFYEASGRMQYVATGRTECSRNRHVER
jgi:hypothetical protein